MMDRSDFLDALVRSGCVSDSHVFDLRAHDARPRLIEPLAAPRSGPHGMVSERTKTAPEEAGVERLREAVLRAAEEGAACGILTQPDLPELGHFHTECQAAAHGSRIATRSVEPGEGRRNCSVRVWEFDETGARCARERRGPESAVFALSPDGMEVAAKSPDGDHLEFLPADETTAERPGFRIQRRLRPAVFSPTGKSLACSMGGAGYFLYDCSSGAVRARVGHPWSVSQDASFFYGDALFAIRDFGSLRIFAVESGNQMWRTDANGGRFAVDPRGDRVAIPSEHGSVTVHSGATGEPLVTLGESLRRGSSGNIDVAFSLVGDRLAVARSADGPSVEITVWETRGWSVCWRDRFSREKYWDLHETPIGISSITFDPTGSRLAASFGWYKTEACMWDAATGRRLWDLGYDFSEKTRSEGRAWLRFSPDGRLLATDEFEGERLVIYDAETGAEVSAFWPGHDGGLPAFSSDGTLFAAGGRVWDVHSGREIRQVRGYLPSADGSRLAAVHNGIVELSDFSTGRLICGLEPADPSDPFQERFHQANVSCLCYSPSMERIASGDDNGRVRIWDLRSGETELPAPDSGCAVLSLAFSASEDVLAVGDVNGRVRLLNPCGYSRMQGRQAHAGRIASLAFSPDGTRLASAGEDGSVRIWAAPWRLIAAMPWGHDSGIAALAFVNGGRDVAIVDRRGAAALWNLRKAESGRGDSPESLPRWDVWVAAWIEALRARNGDVYWLLARLWRATPWLFEEGQYERVAGQMCAAQLGFRLAGAPGLEPFRPDE